MKTLRILCLGSLIALALGVGNAQAQSAWNSVNLSWTTPGDDSLLGTASQFDLRYSTSPITTANFLSALRWTLIAAPGPSGTPQNVTVTGLNPATTYYFAIKTADDVPNWSLISNVVSKTTIAAPDTVRPAQVATLAVSVVTDSTATLAWVAVGDDSLTGTATSYDIRYSTSPITATSFASATPVSGAPLPATPGTSQSVTVRGLGREVAYYFAIRVIDDAGNPSALSNVPRATTTDTMPPAAIRDLTAG